MVLRETDKTVVAGAIKLLQFFNSKKFEKIITALKREDYNDLKVLRCVVEFDEFGTSESLRESIKESPLPNLERFDFTLYLSSREIFFEGNIQSLLHENDFYSAKFHQYRFNHPQNEGDIVEFGQYIKMALEIPKLKGKVDIRTPHTKPNKPLSFEEFLQKGHEIEVFGEGEDLLSFDDYKNFEAEAIAKRERNGLLDFKIIFREIFQDLVYEDEECSELEFNLIRGNPLALLEIGCNWSDFPPRQYQTATEVFTYIRSVTEKFYGLKKQTTKTSTK